MMDPEHPFTRRVLRRLAAAVMDYYNGERTSNDKEALEALMQEAHEALRLALPHSEALLNSR